MKVALILASNTCYAPHLYHYKRILLEKKIDFDIIIWNKDNIIEENCISYNNSTDLKKSRFYRVRSYLNYAKFVKFVLYKNNYDKVIVFTIFLGLLLYPLLKKKYSNLYYFDIRDYSPILNFFPGIIKPVIGNSYFTAISSSGFLKWLPKSKKYVLSHNYSFDSVTNLSEVELLSKTKTILTIGFLRDYHANKAVINSFKNSKDVFLKFVGRGIAYEPLVKYVKENDITNVEFTGGYDKKDEVSYLKNATLINILLGGDLNSKTLMTNRLYLAISNKTPVIVNRNSTQGEYVEKYNLGVVIENADSINNAIINYLKHFDREEFLKGRRDFLSDIVLDQEQFELCFNRFLNNLGNETIN